MKVRDRIKKLREDNFTIIHKIFPEGIHMESNDWIRIYKSKTHGCIDEFLYDCDVEEIDKIPEDILNIEFDVETSWFVGEDLSFDMVINI